MSFAIQHVHVKTKDPKQTMQFYIDNLGATYVAEIPGRGHRLNLHGLTLNITTLISAQNHEQHYGIEHIALDTDDYSGAMAKLRENGVRVLEPQTIRHATGESASWAGPIDFGRDESFMGLLYLRDLDAARLSPRPNVNTMTDRQP